MRMPNARKIFCIGHQKTGTSSLGLALQKLGMRSVRLSFAVNEMIRGSAPRNLNLPWIAPAEQTEAIWASVRATAAGADAIYDSPAAYFVERLDREFPGSKFVMTMRQPEKWLESYKKFFPDRNGRLHRWMYGVPNLLGNEEKFLKVYRERNEAIFKYFANRPKDLLVMDLSAGDGWFELISFLGKDFMPKFPREQPVPPRPGHVRAADAERDLVHSGPPRS